MLHMIKQIIATYQLSQKLENCVQAIYSKSNL